MIPQDFIQQLLARVDIVDVVGRHVKLKRAGANFLGLCPFHGEKSPSFTVSPTKQFYHCFGCGAHGSAIGFLMEHAGQGYVDAIRDLAREAGMTVPESRDIDPVAAAAAASESQSLLAILETAARHYRQRLRDTPRAIDYLKGRGLAGETAAQFGIGYAPAQWRGLEAAVPDYSAPVMATAGLVIESPVDDTSAGISGKPLDNDSGRGTPDSGGEVSVAQTPGRTRRYDRFRDRIMFPIRNVKGECIGFGGRIIGEGTPKYLNSPETPVFSKGRELYGLFEARQALRDSGYVLVTEGYMDVVALAQLGFANAVATLGTACTNEHVQKLFRFTDAVVFSFDGDAAGRRAARKALDGALPYATDVRNVKFLFLPAEHDPDSFIRAHGKDAFARMVSDATPLSRFMVEVAREGCDLDTAEGRAMLATQAKPLWSALPEGVLKTQLLGELAELVGIGERELLRLWQGTAASPNDRRRGATRTGKSWPTAASGPAVRGVSLRRQIPSRQDRALQILFADMQQWAALSPALQHLLMDLAPPHGRLFSWLDQQWHEHGVQPLAALREGLRGHENEASLAQQIDNMPLDMDVDASELQSIMHELEKAHLANQIDELTRRMATDPQAYASIKQLNARLAGLKRAPLV